MSEETKTEEVKFARPPRMSEDDLKKFVREYLSGLIFSSNQCRDEMLPMVFMPLAFGALTGATEDDLKTIGGIWSYWSDAGPRSINGLPMFGACHFMHVEDWDIVGKVIMRELVKLKEIDLNV